MCRKTTPDRSRSAKLRCSAFQVSVSLLITGADSPAVEPRNCPSAGTKSPVERPCRYSSGNTSVIFGVFLGEFARVHRQLRTPRMVVVVRHLLTDADLDMVARPEVLNLDLDPVAGISYTRSCRVNPSWHGHHPVRASRFRAISVARVAGLRRGRPEYVLRRRWPGAGSTTDSVVGPEAAIYESLKAKALA